MSGFVPGQFALCIYPFEPHGPYYDEALPRKGTVYTIREAFDWLHPLMGMIAVVRLVEIVNPVRIYRNGPDEAIFGADCFRPVVDSKLAIFRKALEPVTVRQFVPSLTPST